MIRGRKYILSISIIIFLTSVLSVVCAEDNLIFSRIDPAGDDYGPGIYQYPQHEVFQRGEGLFDIIHFKIYEENSYYEFQFQFTNLIDVWNSRYGFSMPLIEVYIDNEKGGSIALFEEGANVKLNPKFPWDKLLKINGWWISLYVPQDRNKKVVDFTVSGEDVPWVIKNPKIKVEDNWIKLKIEKDKIGPIKKSNLFVIVGGFDPFGYDHFRGIRDEVNSWFFAAEGIKNIDYAPRVIDLIVPPEYSQAEMLSKTQEGLAQIEPIFVGEDNGVSKRDYIIYIIIFFLLIILIYFLEKTLKRRFGVTEDVEEEQQKSD